MRTPDGKFSSVPFESRLWERVDATGDCWEWTGGFVRGGYGRLNHNKRSYEMAHRAVWRVLVGPVPDGFELDHLCRNPGCVNPDHLEVVTRRVNLRRAKQQITTMNLSKAACLQGHDFTPENTYVRPDRPNTRGCRTCRAAAVARYQRRLV